MCPSSFPRGTKKLTLAMQPNLCLAISISPRSLKLSGNIPGWRNEMREKSEKAGKKRAHKLGAQLSPRVPDGHHITLPRWFPVRQGVTSQGHVFTSVMGDVRNILSPPLSRPPGVPPHSVCDPHKTVRGNDGRGISAHCLYTYRMSRPAECHRRVVGTSSSPPRERLRCIMCGRHHPSASSSTTSIHLHLSVWRSDLSSWQGGSTESHWRIFFFSPHRFM